MNRKWLPALVAGLVVLGACGGVDGGDTGSSGGGNDEDPVRLTPVDHEFWDADVSVDGERVVFDPGLGEILVTDLTGATSEPFLQVDAYASRPKFLPDGRVAFIFHPDGESGPQRLAIAPADGSSFEILEDTGYVYDFAASGDGDYIYYTTTEFPKRSDLGTLRRVGVDGTGDLEIAREEEDQSIMFPAVSSDGRLIAFVRTGSYDGTGGIEEPDVIVVADSDGSDEREVGSASGIGAYPTWAPDEARLAFIGSGGERSDGLPLNQIFVASADGGEPVPAGPRQDNLGGPLNWLPDGRILWIYGGATDEWGALFSVPAPSS